MWIALWILTIIVFVIGGWLLESDRARSIGVALMILGFGVGSEIHETMREIANDKEAVCRILYEGEPETYGFLGYQVRCNKMGEG